MTLIAGIISRKPNTLLPASACETLRREISRDERDIPEVYSDISSYLVKLDIGAFRERAAVTGSESSITLLTGEPLLNGEDGKSNRRHVDTAKIHDSLMKGDHLILTTANGAFSAVHYDPSKSEISLIADKLALRPLYYWVSDEYVIFASAMRILEKVDAIPKRLDLRAVTELVGLGYQLSDRTPFSEIRLLRPAEIVTVSGSKITSETYWRWDEIEQSDRPLDELTSNLYQAFSNAVARRNGGDSATAAYLSGGLDSRCIVAALREQDVDVHTFNFSRESTQDQVFGREYAAAAGAIHREIPKQAGDLVPDYSKLMADVWTASQAGLKHPAERANIVWSGEGGSVALGHVHLTEAIADMMRNGNTDGAIDEHLRLEFVMVSPRLFRPELTMRTSTIIQDGIREELSKLHCKDKGRSFFLFLMLNDQHRKLGKHFENIDLHRLEFQLPFFDGSFIAAILAFPMDDCLRHRLYLRWMSLFPPAVTSVPWQAYPGHEPCPIPIPAGLTYQWADEFQTAERAAQKRLIMEQASEMLGSKAFPDRILNKRNLRLASWVHATGLRDYGYLIGSAATIFEYWKVCGGDYFLP